MKLINQKNVLIFTSICVFISSIAYLTGHISPEMKTATAADSAPNITASPINSNDLSGEELKEKTLKDPASIKIGELRFAQNCTAYCHGDKGIGGDGAPLQCQPEHTPEYLFPIISDGKKSGSRYMPAWKDSFNEKERWELVAFILSLKDLPHC